MTTAFAETAFAEAAFAEGLDDLGVVKPYARLLENPSRAIVIACSVETFDDSTGPKWTYLATHGFATDADDTPASTQFAPRLEEAFTIEAAVPTTSLGHYAGVATTVLGEATFRNDDDGLASLAEEAVDGRRIVVELGQIGADGAIRYSDFGRVMEMRGESWEWAGRALRLRLLDPLSELDRPMQHARYAGVGGAEGPTELAFKTKPVTLGRCAHVEATLVDPAYLVYQVDSGPIQDIVAVYDSGVLLNADDNQPGQPTAAPIADITGGYDKLVAHDFDEEAVVQSREAGMFRLRSAPAGVVTADVKGRVLTSRIIASRTWSDGRLWIGYRPWAKTTTTGRLVGYLETHAGLIATVLTTGAFWSEDRIDLGSLVDLDTEQPAICGYHIPAGDERSMRQVLDDICVSCGAVAWIDRLSRLRVRRLDAPAATTPRSLDERSIINAERLTPPFTVPPFRWVLGFDRVWRTFATSELAGQVLNTATQARLQEEFRDAVYEDAYIRVRHPTSRSTQRIPGLFVSRTDAEAEAARLGAFYAPGRVLLRIVTKHLFAVDIGETVQVTMNRWGLSSGRNLVVVGVATDISRRETALTLFG